MVIVHHSPLSCVHCCRLIILVHQIHSQLCASLSHPDWQHAWRLEEVVSSINHPLRRRVVTITTMSDAPGAVLNVLIDVEVVRLAC